MLDGRELDVELLDMRGAGATSLLNRGRIFSLTLGLGDRVAGGIRVALQSFDFLDGAAAQTVERRDLLERLIGIESAVFQTIAHRVQVLADERWVEHRSTIVYSPPTRSSDTIFPCVRASARRCSLPPVSAL